MIKNINNKFSLSTHSGTFAVDLKKLLKTAQNLHFRIFSAVITAEKLKKCKNEGLRRSIEVNRKRLRMVAE